MDFSEARVAALAGKLVKIKGDPDDNSVSKTVFENPFATWDYRDISSEWVECGTHSD